MNKPRSFSSKLASMMAMLSFNPMPSMQGSSNGHLRQRFSLSGLPPKWKGKRMARIMRGGR